MEPCRHPRSEATLLFPARDYVTGDAFEVCLCPGCGLTVTLPQPSGEGMEAYYPAAYHRRAGARRFPGVVEWLQRVLYGARARRVEQLAGGAGRVLDVGCGPGWLLQAFRRRGWDACGTELSDRSAAHARDQLGLPVHVGPMDSWPWPDGHFDAVVMWHALEHWPDPRLAVERVARLLRPGGVFLVGVPNFGSLEARRTRSAWFHLDVPRHLVHLTPAALSAALSAAGLEVRHTSFLVPEYDSFSFVQSALNRMGIAHNLLYDLVRGRESRLSRGRAGALSMALTLLLSVPLGLLALPVTSLLSLAGQGSSMTLHAVKRPPR